jgi:hypothetical protein
MEQPMLERIKQWMVRPKMTRLAFYAGCIGLAVLAYGIEVHMQNSQQVLGEISSSGSSGQLTQPGSISNAQQAQLSALLEMNQLITTLGTTLMGALGFLLANRKAASKSRGLWAAFASFASVGLSIYFGYRAYRDIIEMLQNAQNIGWFDVISGVIAVDRECHFLFFVLGVFFFADFAFHELNQGGAADASSA